jgi:cohesin complex subunit SA-1/2
MDANAASDEDGADGANADEEEEDGEGEEEQEEEDFEVAPKPKGRKSTRKAAAEPKKSRGQPPAKKPKATVQKPPPKTAGTKRGRKVKNADSEPFDAEQIAKETKINADNPLFSASY